MVQNNKISVFTVIRTVFLMLVIAATLYPFIYMFSVSVSSDIYVMKNEISFFPKGFNLKMYKFVFQDSRIFTAYKNTIIYVAIGTVISLVITSAGAFALSKKYMIFNKTFNIMIVITMFFGGGMIPTYLTVKNLGLYDTIWAIVLPGAVSTWNLMVMRTFFSQFPTEIEESGKIDGLNDLGVFFYLVLPVSKAILATIGLFYAVSLWNSYLGPLMYLKTQEKYPLQIILREILLSGSNFNNDVVSVGGDSVVVEESLKYATAIVSIVPIVAVYPFLQKYFVKGVMVGSVKG
ncbi:carbohydrate ABC transporter permease [Clostridium swellfunianum]|uniref:carbohydrate ABC transporter permease n=1 Tax=Clostridium swellfunianum TaxID=1367462 RepID=UPI00202E1BD3|nr:carbohydrate ABC transporter permease [Clostridium swellfunianum]MCM0650896.1 carbohydrate ABC transporter permease [Clostridium swellfunianum]